MSEQHSARELLEASAPALLALVVLASAPLWQSWLPAPAPAPFWLLPVFAVLAVGAALYAPSGRWTLGLGTSVLPAAALFFGPAMASGLAGGVYLLRQIFRHFVLRDPLRRHGDLSLLPTVADGGRVMLAALAGTLV
ncbi:MAG: hypothetical protein V3T81_08790, partial [Thermoanaerobaculia bacterium]